MSLLFYGVILLPEHDPWSLSIPNDDLSTRSSFRITFTASKNDMK